MEDQLSCSMVEGNLPAHQHDPALVKVALRKIQKHYLDQGFTRHPASLRAVLAIAALVRLAEKKCHSNGVAYGDIGQKDTASSLLKAALEHFEAVSDSRDVG